MARTVKWGVLGTARIGTEKVIPAMRRGERSEIVAIASRDGDKARAAAAALGIPRAYASYEELLADHEIEAVYNPLPNHLHVPWSIKALEAGKHVLCEKPVALDAAGARELAEAAATADRLVAEAFMVRHHPQWRAALDIVASGRIGDAHAVQTAFAYHLTDPGNIRNRADIGGGGLYDIGCYAVATARLLFAAEPARAIGLFEEAPDLGIDRMASGLAEFGGGRHLAFTCATQLAPCQSVRILGRRGRIEIEIPFNPSPTAETRVTVDDGRDLSGGGRETIVVPPVDQYTLQGDAFSRAVLGEEPLAWDMADAVLNMRVIDALFRSRTSGRWETP